MLPAPCNFGKGVPKKRSLSQFVFIGGDRGGSETLAVMVAVQVAVDSIISNVLDVVRWEIIQTVFGPCSHSGYKGNLNLNQT